MDKEDLQLELLILELKARVALLTKKDYKSQHDLGIDYNECINLKNHIKSLINQ